MPIALDPDSTFKIILRSDEDKPEDSKPAFIFKYPTGRQWRKIAQVQDNLDDIESSNDLANKVFDSVKTLLVGWENMVDTTGQCIGYDQEKLEDILTLPEAEELIFAVLNQVPNFKDKKKLDLPLDSDTSSSVKTVKD
ncbi:MAG: hypothetical protein JXA04_01340 [Gammaproteobacteria bacterium]|nr:hypothetical protein [Gammaproteobacteria bacterium]